ncbi:hypothetical protein HPB48_026774 [Haemaphysalis longicornis]|uniref:Uncharacterized protein n=1 Tax=Haemaphysalis longicornis TaxID=44386 RepID=A0A9J6HCP6_HAELO|nr:hypothetical protein HPB48_026774 [Haemaphysalis longicornis]
MDVTSPHEVAPEASSFVVPSQIQLPDDVDDMNQQSSDQQSCSKEDDDNNIAPWIKITRRAQRKKQTGDETKQELQQQAKATSSSENDYKMMIRPRNGLALRKISPYTLACSILHEAKLTRLGETGTILITFTGKKVPFFVYIRGAEPRGFLYKRTHAFCHLCNRSQSRYAHCKRCGLLRQKDVPHHCQPMCAVCGGEHVTASRDQWEEKATRGHQGSPNKPGVKIPLQIQSTRQGEKQDPIQVQVLRGNAFRQAKIC